MFSLTDTLVTFAAGGLTVGVVVWLAMRVSRLETENAELRNKQEAGQAWAQTVSRLEAENADLRHKQEAGPAWAQTMKLDHRQQLASIAVLQEIATKDQLDALMRLSPEAVRRVVQQIAPHLFEKGPLQ